MRSYKQVRTIMWLTQKDFGIEDIFCDDVIYAESWGSKYENRTTVKQWFQEWNARGKVLVWESKQFFHQANQTVVEWYFKNQMNNGTIEEFGCNRNHYNPYQNSATPEFRNDTIHWF